MRSRFACLPVLLLALATADAAAQAYPARPVKVVVAFAPATTSDILARMVSQQLAVSMGQPFVVENRSGSGGNIGAEFVAKSAPDGYTLLLSTIAISISQSVHRNLRYDAVRDLAGITIVMHSPHVLAANPGIEPKTVADLLRYAKANPGKLNYGSNGNGTSTHLASEKLKLDAGIDMQHVPYKSAGAAHADLVAGQIQVMFDNIVTLSPFFKSGKLRPLAVSSARRHPLLPDVPSVAEAGVRDFEVVTWLGFAAPAGTPREIVNQLNVHIVRTLSIPEVRQWLVDAGAEIIGGSPEAADRHMQKEIERWSTVVRLGNIKVE